MIQAVLREMGLLPEDVVFVGDTLTDVDTGKQAGVDVYTLPTGFHSKMELSQKKPRRILKNLKELTQIVISKESAGMMKIENGINPLFSPHPPVS